ncbi:MAG: 16S rRNA (cytidine(1402)-2'-O)-methyltransferase, partial [Longimicrobiales bacterium]
MSRLHLVSTPIGNLADTTYRAVEVLGSVARILAEDTRRTRILLNHFDVGTPLVSLHEHNEAARVADVLGWLGEGEELALVSDAGTPLLSDPGETLVAAVLEAGFRIVPVPGASAALAALVASGFATSPFTFYGFPPRSGKAREARLGDVAALPHVAVLYESPNRLARLLVDMAALAGEERRVAVARELTKLHEEVWRGTLGQAMAYYGEEAVRGEVVVVLEGGAALPAAGDAAAADAARDVARRMLSE